jgi:hypothetical protein
LLFVGIVVISLLDTARRFASAIADVVVRDITSAASSVNCGARYEHDRRDGAANDRECAMGSATPLLASMSCRGAAKHP